MLLTAGVAAPIDLLEYFKMLDMPLTEAYGMTENAGGITVNCLQRIKMGSFGQPYPSTYVRIDKPDHRGNGEVLVYCILSLEYTVHNNYVPVCTHTLYAYTS